MSTDDQHKRKMIEAFELSILRDAKSAVFREYCRRVHGVDRFQYNSLTSAHFEQLLHALALSPSEVFADVGCAVGTMTVEVARRTGAGGLGVDVASGVIAAAQQNTPPDVDVSFMEGDLDDLQLRPSSVDAIIAIDSLYFARDLGRSLERLLAALRPGGRLVAFYSAFRRLDERDSVLAPDGTALATALRVHGAAYEAIDLSNDDRAHWKRAVAATEALRPQWQAAGELAAWEARDAENAELVPLVEAGRSARFMYVVRRR